MGRLKDKLEVEIMDLAIMDETIDAIGTCLEHVADDFAIGFAEWLVIQYNEDTIYSEYTTKELLEIYKKEKGL
jgi:hypothetical protein